MINRYLLYLIPCISLHVFASTLPWGERRDLENFFLQAKKNGHSLIEAKNESLRRLGDLKEIQGRQLPELSVTALGAPIPSASGDALNGSTDWSKWGFLGRISVELRQPIYTFGALSSGKQAAELGVEAAALNEKRAEANLYIEVAKIYYSYQLAFEFKQLAKDIEKNLSKALKTGQKKKGSRQSVQHSKLQFFLYEAQSRLKEAEAGQEKARTAMALKIGSVNKSRPRWDQGNLKKQEFPLAAFDVLKKRMLEKRPEFKALKKASEAYYKVFRARGNAYYPQLFLAAKLDWTSSSSRDNQSSPFAYDPYNQFAAGIALGLKWDIGWGSKRGELAKSEADYLKAQAEQSYFSQALVAEFEIAYLESKKWKEIVDHRKQALTLAKKLFQDSYVAYELRNTKQKELAEVMQLYVKAKKDYLESLLKYNILTTKLSRMFE